MGLANVCNVGVEKQYTWKKLVLHTGRKCCSNVWTADDHFAQQIMGRREGFEQFSKFKSVVTYVQAECSGLPSTSKMDKHMNTGRNLFFQIEDSVLIKLLICWEFYLGEFKAFWKTMWPCAEFPPNSCPKLLTLLWKCIISFSKQNYSHSMTSLLNRFSAIWLLSFPKTQHGVKGQEI